MTWFAAKVKAVANEVNQMEGIILNDLRNRMAHK